jgi:hypothetical protein
VAGKKETVFVVERLNWRCYGDGCARLPGTTRLQSFPTYGEAEADRRRREAAAREQINPFLCGGPALHYQTSLDEGRLHDWLIDAGLTPPKLRKGRPVNWAGWWRHAHSELTALQREKVWEALDKIHFFEAVERPQRPVVYVVVQINWRYNDEWFIAEPEGGLGDTAFRDRQAALDHCDDCNDVARSAWEGSDADLEFDLSSRRASEGDPLTTAPPTHQQRHADLVGLEEAKFYEVVEAELEE